MMHWDRDEAWRHEADAHRKGRDMSDRVEATHTNYNTGEPCFCDAPFDYQPGPCVDAPEPTTGTSPENGSG